MRKKNSLIFVILLSIAGLIAVIGTASAEPSRASGVLQQQNVVEIYFNPPVTIEEALRTVEQSGLTVLELHHQYTINGTVYSGGYQVPPGMPSANIQQQYQSQFESQFSIILGESESASIISAFSTLGSLTENGGLRVSQVTAQGISFQSDQIQHEKDVSRIETYAVPQLNSQGPSTHPTDWPRDILNTLLDQGLPWWPTTGHITTDWASYNHTIRYIYQEFKWTQSGIAQLNDGQHEACGSYESDGVYYNYDELHFLGDPSGYWSSNLPAAYLDTNAFDDPHERVYTVGSSDSDSILPQVDYYTYIIAGAGNADDDAGKVVGQKGHRVPCWCHSKWCVFADASTFIVPAWCHIVRGRKYWGG